MHSGGALSFCDFPVSSLIDSELSLCQHPQLEPPSLFAPQSPTASSDEGEEDGDEELEGERTGEQEDELDNTDDEACSLDLNSESITPSPYLDASDVYTNMSTTAVEAGNANAKSPSGDGDVYDNETADGDESVASNQVDESVASNQVDAFDAENGTEPVEDYPIASLIPAGQPLHPQFAPPEPAAWWQFMQPPPTRTALKASLVSNNVLEMVHQPGFYSVGTVCVFRQKSTPEDVIGFHACSLQWHSYRVSTSSYRLAL
jgi:hypothetical protein